MQIQKSWQYLLGAILLSAGVAGAYFTQDQWKSLISAPALPFFIPIAFAEQVGLGFWGAFTVEIVLASATIGLWIAFGPKL